MLIPVLELKNRLKIKPSGILHLGADVGQEAEAYHRMWRCPVWWVEARGDAYEQCRRNVARYRHKVICAALGETAGEKVTMHVASNGQSSSLLPFGTHAVEHPEVTYTGSTEMVTFTVDDLVAQHRVKADFVNLDLQGVELRVLRGALDYLPSARWIYCEVNRAELYEGCDQFTALDDFLSEQGFDLLEMRMYAHTGWGDGIWERRP